MTDYNKKLTAYQQVSDYLKQENNSLSKRFYVFDLDKKCDICFLNIFTDVFYTFNCSHSFHKGCIEQKLIEFGAGDRVIKIHELESGLRIGLKKYGKFVENSFLMRKFSQFCGRI